MILFYTPDVAGDLCVLDQEESQHIFRVLRLKPGDYISSTDGKGNLYSSEIVSVEGKRCTIRILETFSDSILHQKPVSNSRRPEAIGLSARNYRLHLAVAPTKNIERFEWFLEKATEIGVDEITPIHCEHSERKEVRQDRLEKVIIAAMKQSLKLFKPILHEMTGFDEFIDSQRAAPGGQYFIAHLSDKTLPLKALYVPGRNATILIGPEGDFSEKELQLAASADIKSCTLGMSRLRTETAAVVACEAIALLNE